MGFCQGCPTPAGLPHPGRLYSTIDRPVPSDLSVPDDPTVVAEWRPPLSSVLSPADTEWRPGCVIRPATTADAAAIAKVQGVSRRSPTGGAERTIDGFRPRALAKVPDTLVACDWTGAAGYGGGSIVGVRTANARVLSQFQPCLGEPQCDNRGGGHFRKLD